jgi:hypothetical protein
MLAVETKIGIEAVVVEAGAHWLVQARIRQHRLPPFLRRRHARAFTIVGREITAA